MPPEALRPKSGAKVRRKKSNYGSLWPLELERFFIARVAHFEDNFLNSFIGKIEFVSDLEIKMLILLP